MSSFTDIHSSKRFPLGKRIRKDGAEYIYAKGVASLAAGSWVTVDEVGVTALLDTDSSSKGRVAVSMSANTSSTAFSWFQVYGYVPAALCLASFLDNGSVFMTSTGGSVDDSGAGAEVFVYGATGRSARDTTTGMAAFELNYPWVGAEALD